MKGCIALLLCVSSVYLVLSESDFVTQECPPLRCGSPCESPGFRGRDNRGCPTCDCNCPVLEECSILQCPAGQVPFTQSASVTGCERCLCVDGNNKPGTCPHLPPDQVGACTTECSRDADCVGNQKCCGNCPRKCVEGVTRQLEKPGNCPRRIPNFGNCRADCQKDTDCPGSQKCCGNCPRTCLQPRGGGRTLPPLPGPPSSGQCPRRFQRRRRPCNRFRQDRCTTNADCSNGRICCGSCHKRCVRQRFPRRRQPVELEILQ